MRVLIALLILLNLAYFAWSTVRNLDQRATQPAISRSDVKLLKEDPADVERLPADAQPPKVVVPVDRPPPAALAECYALGPFKSLVSLERIAQELSLRGIMFNRRVEQGRSAEDYWVYIPPQTSRDAALELSRSLAERGVKDYYVVSVNEKRNAISLGLFPDKEAASRRAEEVSKLGYAVATDVRYADATAYWLDVGKEGGDKLLDSSLQIFLNQASVKPSTRACEAHPAKKGPR